jgi:hypothetical protein
MNVVRERALIAERGLWREGGRERERETEKKKEKEKEKERCIHTRKGGGKVIAGCVQWLVIDDWWY